MSNVKKPQQPKNVDKQTVESYIHVTVKGGVAKPR